MVNRFADYVNSFMHTPHKVILRGDSGGCSWILPNHHDCPITILVNIKIFNYYIKELRIAINPNVLDTALTKLVIGQPRSEKVFLNVEPKSFAWPGRGCPGLDEDTSLQLSFQLTAITSRYC